MIFIVGVTNGILDFFFSHATARFLRDAGIPDQVKVFVYLPLGSNFHGGFHAQNLQLYQWP